MKPSIFLKSSAFDIWNSYLLIKFSIIIDYVIKDKKETEEKEEEEKDLNSASNDNTELVEMSTDAAATKVETDECNNDDVTDVKKEKSTRSKK